MINKKNRLLQSGFLHVVADFFAAAALRLPLHKS
jgi:hypothetical protein